VRFADTSLSYAQLRRRVHGAVRYLDTVFDDIMLDDTVFDDTALDTVLDDAALDDTVLNDTAADDTALDDCSPVALVGPTSYPWVLAFLAVVCSGRAAVPIDAALDAQTVALMARRAGAQLVLVDGPAQASALSAAGLTSVDLTQVATAAEADERPEDASLAALGRVTPEALAVKIFTSGTAGVAKLVHLSHDNLASNAAASAAMVAGLDEITIVAVLPLHHLYGLNTTVVTAFLVGATVCFGDGPRRVARDMARFAPHILVVVPMVVQGMYQAVWREAERTGRTRSLRRAVKVSNLLRKVGIDIRRWLFGSIHRSFGGRLQIVVSGGARLAPQYVTGFDDLGLEVLVGYGITECSPLVSFNRRGASRPGTVGQLAAGVRVTIVDDEICVGGPGVMVGYDTSEHTEQAVVDGWFRTGDKGQLDADGYLTITGRLKSLIIGPDGNNVDPEEIEQALAEHEIVESVLVMGTDEKIVALVHPSSQAQGLTATEVAAEVDLLVADHNRRVPAYKRIYRAEVVGEPFERTSLGKVKRYLYSRQP